MGAQITETPQKLRLGRTPGLMLPFRPKVNRKPFKTIPEARLALTIDKLGTVTRRNRQVFVSTINGAGTFSAEEWDTCRA